MAAIERIWVRPPGNSDFVMALRTFTMRWEGLIFPIRALNDLVLQVPEIGKQCKNFNKQSTASSESGFYPGLVGEKVNMETQVSCMDQNI
jgi:hypothetical protein